MLEKKYLFNTKVVIESEEPEDMKPVENELRNGILKF
jgi:hypothetical protein